MSSISTPTFRPVMTKVEAADYLRVSPRTLTNLLAARRLRAARIGRRVLFKRAELDRFVDLLTQQGV
jgi:excisionase family DNA binding protein